MKNSGELMKANSELGVQSEWVFASSGENVYKIRFSFFFFFN